MLRSLQLAEKVNSPVDTSAKHLISSPLLLRPWPGPNTSPAHMTKQLLRLMLHTQTGTVNGLNGAPVSVGRVEDFSSSQSPMWLILEIFVLSGKTICLQGNK